MKRYITHVRKDDQERIIQVRTVELELTTQEVVNRITKKLDTFFVQIGNSEIPVGIYKEKWIRTYSDGKWTNNLDNLPRF